MSFVALARRSPIWLALAVVALALLAALGVNRLMAGTGCTTAAEGSIAESASFTPYENRLSHLDPSPLNPSGAALPDVPADARVPSNAIDGLSLQWASVAENGAVYQLFLDGPISRELTSEEFMANGGLEFDREPVPDGGSFATYLLNTSGERAVQVMIGNHVGALVWADPDINGLRTHNLYWSDGKYNYSLIADRSAAHLVNLGRGSVCS